jgi:hypothetical protein
MNLRKGEILTSEGGGFGKGFGPVARRTTKSKNE